MSFGRDQINFTEEPTSGLRLVAPGRLALLVAGRSVLEITQGNIYIHPDTNLHLLPGSGMVDLGGSTLQIDSVVTLKFTASSNQLVFDSDGAHPGTLTWTPTTSDKTITLPNSTGTVALTSDLPVGSNPTGSAGLSAVNGSATTFLRSDGAPAISQTITPTWSGLHTFGAGITLTSGQLLLPAGTSALPGLELPGGAGIYQPDAGRVGISTSDTLQWAWSAGGNLTAEQTGVTFGWSGVTLSRASTNVLGLDGGFSLVAPQPGSIGTTPGTPAVNAFAITGGTGGNTSITTTGIGGVGALISLVAGTGGTAALATTASTGGKGGALTISSGAGGPASAATGDDTGGAGGLLTISGGVGGAATVGGGTLTGGAGGSIAITAGAAGAGGNAAGGTITITPGAATGTGALGYLTLVTGYNFGMGTTTFGTSATNTLALFNGTAPSTSLADTVQLFSTDIFGGDATLGIRTEATVTTETVVSDRTLRVKINGTSYAICLKA